MKPLRMVIVHGPVLVILLAGAASGGMDWGEFYGTERMFEGSVVYLEPVETSKPIGWIPAGAQVTVREPVYTLYSREGYSAWWYDVTYLDDIGTTHRAFVPGTEIAVAFLTIEEPSDSTELILMVGVNGWNPGTGLFGCEARVIEDGEVLASQHFEDCLTGSGRFCYNTMVSTLDPDGLSGVEDVFVFSYYVGEDSPESFTFMLAWTGDRLAMGPRTYSWAWAGDCADWTSYVMPSDSGGVPDAVILLREETAYSAEMVKEVLSREATIFRWDGASFTGTDDGF